MIISASLGKNNWHRSRRAWSFKSTKGLNSQLQIKNRDFLDEYWIWANTKTNTNTQLKSMDSHWIRANFAKASTIMGFHGPVSINLSAPSTANSFNFVLLGKKRTKQLQPVWLELFFYDLFKTKPTKPESTRSQAYSLTCDPFLSVLRKGNKETNQEPQIQ